MPNCGAKTDVLVSRKGQYSAKWFKKLIREKHTDLVM